MTHQSGKPRTLLVVADDFGIGVETSKGILELLRMEQISGALLLVNSPYAEASMNLCLDADERTSLGWHPNLTLDRPVSDPARVRSLVGGNGKFFSLGEFLARLFLGRIRVSDLETELQAQLNRFERLTNSSPAYVAGHHHIHTFPYVGTVLRRLLASRDAFPHLRRVKESFSSIGARPGARVKRMILSAFGSRASACQKREQFPGADSFLGIVNGAEVPTIDNMLAPLAKVSSDDAEWMVHPGRPDDSLRERDEVGMGRRVQEFELLRQASFADAIFHSGWRITPSAEWLTRLRLAQNSRPAISLLCA